MSLGPSRSTRVCVVICLLGLLAVIIFRSLHAENTRKVCVSIEEIKPSTQGWVTNSRSIPAALPPKSVSDWDFRTGPLTDGRSFEEEFIPCPSFNYNETAPIYRYKYFNGSWYSDREHLELISGQKLPYCQYREPFVAALLFAAWLYKDFPQMDFIADFADHSRGCANATVLPYIKYSSLDLEAISATAKGKGYLRYDAPGMVNRQMKTLRQEANLLLNKSSGVGFNSVGFNSVDRVLGEDSKDVSSTGAGSSSRPQSTSQLQVSEVKVPMNQGFVIPTPEAWKYLCWDKAQLENYVKCSNEKYPWSSKEKVVFWRGSTSGRQYLFPEDEGLDPQELMHLRRSNKGKQRPLSIFGNKRVIMAVMSRAYSFLDIGITDPGGMKHIWYPATADQIQKPGVELPQWGASTITVSIDGHGPPYRLPFQLLGGSVTLVQKSPHVTWLEAYKDDLWKPGVHYESFEYDLSDFVTKARELVHRPREQLQAMAEAAQKSGVELLNVFSLLDSIMWSLMRVKEVSQWEVRPPEPGSVWKVVKMKKGEWFQFAHHGVPLLVKSAIEDRFSSNFLPVEENL
ncbi:hypothetical protein CEUSTIGMA_g4466.t1 [Chlamydomonas eustigma]|uniref:Glycosyl transferase CAP10 domain-containing protein n=1 Tax=Chlamydomonas eustigma TaxID=1157962 RepID=A0A250X257_9CHLO|nr:hypothetical protein CEUSTIGMA_g4466.t1 [Chlamydomonas eustigma]|eukprot:GAX77019.1 hypothetical protein CEUSTIGMA_g4466.t1 [Chlamydomonas eustigma]